MTIEELLDPLTLKDFLSARESRQVLQIHKSDSFLSHSPTFDDLLHFDMDHVILSRFQQGRWEATPSSNLKSIQEAFASGFTIKLCRLDLTHPWFKEFAQTLRIPQRRFVTVNAYITPRKAQALPRHTDDYDTFTVQIDGEKRWCFDDDEAFLRKGDVLYVPAMVPHAVVSTNQSSISLAIGLQRQPRWLFELTSRIHKFHSRRKVNR